MSQDDGPRDNSSDSDPSPIILHVDSLIIHKRDDGSYSIGGDKTTVSFSVSALNPAHIHHLCFPYRGQRGWSQTQNSDVGDGQLSESGPRGREQRLQDPESYADPKPSNQPQSFHQRKGETNSTEAVQ